MATLVIYILAFGLAYSLLRTRYYRSLNKINGPFLASFTNLWKVWYAFTSSQKQFYVDIHHKYGDVVRVGPTELSFGNPQAIREIYGTQGSSQKVGDLHFGNQSL